MPEMTAPPPMPEMPAPPPMPEMPAPPPMPEMPAPPPMPEVSDPFAPVHASSEPQADEVPELPDPLSALDLLSSTIAESPSNDWEMSADDVAESSDEDELNVADYKWKESVLEAVIEKFGISDRDAFLVHATAYDSNNNMYLTKQELTDAAKDWVDISKPIEEMPSDPVLEPVVELTPPPMPEPAVELTPPPMPEPAVELTPPPMPEPAVELTPPPMPEPVVELTPPPMPEPAVELPPPPMPEPAVDVASPKPSVVAGSMESDEQGDAATDDYRELWKRRSDKSLPQMYGAIDRIGSGEIGSLLDRYSDRFGHELDREIIVMRRAEQEARREAVPVVELISAPETDEEEGSLQSQLTEVEDLLRPLQKQYKASESNAEKKALAPALKSLIAERKILIAVIAGEMGEDALEDIPVRPVIPGYEETDDEEDDEEVEEVGDFAQFFASINQLLGDMPESWVNNFLESKGFALFQKVGEDPEATNEKTRKKFFVMINNELGSMPEDMLDEFVASPDFELYKAMGELYGE
ncbi:MAG: hypothetical protein VYB40_02575 [Candidatus Thermoplasmatota archaeon]|nr:hypothetical protein [Candidatus Thermoplasmatota archaeon]